VEKDEPIREHYTLSLKYLAAAQGNLAQGLHEPALANGIHALELGIKALLHSKLAEPLKTHNVGGLLGRHFREELGTVICRTANRILISYNLPRYPSVAAPHPDDVKVDLKFITDLVDVKIRELIAPVIGQ